MNPGLCQRLLTSPPLLLALAWPSMLLNTLSLPPSSLVALSPLHLYLDLLLPLTAIRYWYRWLWKVEIYVILSLALGFPGGSDR